MFTIRTRKALTNQQVSKMDSDREYDDQDWCEEYDSRQDEDQDEDQDQDEGPDQDWCDKRASQDYDWCDERDARCSNQCDGRCYQPPTRCQPGQNGLDALHSQAKSQLIKERNDFIKRSMGELPPEHAALFAYEPSQDAINARVAENSRAFMAKIQPGIREDDGMGNAVMVQLTPKESQ